LKDTVLARRYAKALFELAVEKKILETIQNEVRSFSQSLDDYFQFRLFFFAQDVSKKQKRQKIEELIQERVSNVFFNFVLVLLKKNREFIFPQIVKEFQAIVDKHHRKINALAITTQPLDEISSSKLKSLLDKTFDADVQIKNDIDSSILGGIVVNVEGYVFDGSLQSQLARLKDDLVSNSKN